MIRESYSGSILGAPSFRKPPPGKHNQISPGAIHHGYTKSPCQPLQTRIARAAAQLRISASDAFATAFQLGSACKGTQQGMFEEGLLCQKQPQLPRRLLQASPSKAGLLASRLICRQRETQQAVPWPTPPSQPRALLWGAWTFESSPFHPGGALHRSF